MATSFIREYHLSNNETCTFCGKEIKYKEGYVFWGTSGSNTQFHKECAKHFSIGLAFDAIKLQYEQRGMKIPFSNKDYDLQIF